MLTDKALRALKPKESLYRVADSAGLCIEVAPTGSKLWRYRYRFAGRAKMLSLGAWPEVSLAEARERRGDARRLLNQGVDPSANRQSEKLRAKVAADNTFKAVAEEWLEMKGHDWTASQLGKERDRLENHAYPWLGKLPISDIGVAELKPVLARLVKRGTIEQAHRLRQEISRIFRYAVATERASRDPAHDLRDVLPSPLKKNFASITDPTKVGELLRAIDGFEGTFVVGCALRLAPLVFVRPGEIRAAEWKEIELEHKDGPRWVIPAARRKLRKAEKENPNTPPHVVPLSTQAVAILEELQPLTGQKRLVFPGARNTSIPLSNNTINAALRRMGYDKDAMTGHGFRHMASTLLNELGFNKAAIERQLSHREPGVAGVYNKAQHLPERQKMMQAWADYLDGLRADTGKVVPIQRKKSGASR
ncbi:integrase [Lysobacter daejeonensis GH1-9]|uniref:Integrase n=1 Tax=Lysobacter daejeonensis GH1-9 TaxID=1385517 RepID=A0A0A0EWJ7_9GAMM|nr:integrase arm-type DNA-binding domain-containing protein [Lysobacter daejeonensis]KGM54660.1 integrase [Lysobacter daejeonensis GH1-9]